jgi:hypothetical protein
MAAGQDVPVGFDGGDLRVVVVVVVIAGSLEVLRDSVTEENAEDLVLDGVGLVLIEGDQDKGFVHEVLVLKEGSQEGLQLDTGNGDGGVMAVGGHVGG